MDEETIRLTAYRIWEQQGKPDGQDFVHWLQAKDELTPTLRDGSPSSIETSVTEPVSVQSTHQAAPSATARNARGKKLKA